MLENFSDLHFIRPLWLVALLPCAWFAWRFISHNRESSGWRGVIDAQLLRVQLAPAPAASQRISLWLLAAGLALCVLALAGPSWQRLPQPVEQKRDALVIVLDLSLSMYATDIVPSRLVRARQKITDILRQRSEGFTALVAYSGDAHAVAPLTDDTRTIENLVAALNPAMMPVPGSDPAGGSFPPPT